MIMTVNKYFNNLYYGPEQDMFNDIVQEVIQIHGSDILYICRDVEEFDELLREEKVSVFKTTYSIDAYVPNTGQNNTMQKLMSKFGFRFEENMEIYISALSWDQLGTSFAQPRNGDYIYIGNPEDTYSSFTNCMFMICDVVDGFPDTMHFGSIASWKLTISSIKFISNSSTIPLLLFFKRFFKKLYCVSKSLISSLSSFEVLSSINFFLPEVVELSA